MKLNVMSEQTACLMDSWVKDWSGNITEKGKNENVVLDIFLHRPWTTLHLDGGLEQISYE